jgi:hypothetical protein
LHLDIHLCVTPPNKGPESPNFPDQDKNKIRGMAIDRPGFLADCGHPGHVPARVEMCSQCASASIVEQLASTDAANTEFEAPLSGGLFRAAHFY